MSEIKHLLILPHVLIHNANALSSPFTIGFPAMTAWLGAVHALQRHCQSKGLAVNFDAVAVVSHDMDLQTYRGENDYVSSIVGTGNPLDKTGARSSFIEEARCHLDISLVIEYSNITSDVDHDQLPVLVKQLLLGRMKMAGGDIKSVQMPEVLTIEDGHKEDMPKIKRLLMPGYVLIERRDLMVHAMEKGMDAVDAMIDFLAVHHTPESPMTLEDVEETEEGGTAASVDWRSFRRAVDNKPAGWIVPIATGFHGISPLGQAKNQRDETCEHRFAESIVTLGEFKMPHRFTCIEDMLWRYQFDADNNFYLCEQRCHCDSADYIDQDKFY